MPFSLHGVSEAARPLTRWQARLRRRHPVAGFAVFRVRLRAGRVRLNGADPGRSGRVLPHPRGVRRRLRGLPWWRRGCWWVFPAPFTVARAEERTIERIKAQAPTVKRWGGWVLMGVGAWFIVLAVFANLFARVFPV